MKTSNRILILSFLGTLLISSSFAQVSSNDQNQGDWKLGINAGSAFQQSDVSSDLQGWGAGLTLGKNIFYQPNALFSVDLRGRAQYSQSYGLDYFKSTGIEKNEALNGVRGPDYTVSGDGPGYVYTNHRTDMGELSMEGVLNFNKLRENSNVNLSLYGGIGLGAYGTTINQKNGSQTYADDYLALDDKSSVSYKKAVLKNDILDGSYETRADGFKNGVRAGFMPVAGVELGYQLSPNFSLGLGHKITFSNSDYLDGQKWTNSNSSTGDNDILHYSNVSMNFTIPNKQKRLAPPKIVIHTPARSPLTTKLDKAVVKATIRNVQSAIDVSCRINGRDVNFNFYKDNFSLDFWLEPGKNEVLIRASNLAGIDQEKVVIFYEEPYTEPYYPPGNGGYEPPIVISPPIVKITNPSVNTSSATNQRASIRARITNVDYKSQIRFEINGRKSNDFSLNGNSFNANIRLKAGENFIYISAQNEAGYDEDEVVINIDEIYCEDPEPVITYPPEVEITQVRQGAGNQANRDQCEATILAKIKNVDSKSDIKFLVNGRRNSAFNFDAARETFRTTIRLNSNVTSIKIIATNEDGRAEDIASAQACKIERPLHKPVVDITAPAAGSRTDKVFTEVLAVVQHVESKSDIIFHLNDEKITDFSYNTQSDRLSKRIKLREGQNTILIKAYNRTGANQQIISVYYKAPVVYTLRLPEVTITKPTGSKTSKSTIEIQATVKNVKRRSDINLTVNGRQINSFDFSAGSMLLKTTTELQKGLNKIVIKVETDQGEDQDVHNITYEVPALPPSISIASPQTNSSTTSSDVSLNGRVENVKSKSEVSVILNGKSTDRFDLYDNVLNAKLQLKQGNNSIIVKARNAAGMDEVKIDVFYKPAVVVRKPTVIISNPTNNSTSNSSNITVKATIKNIKDRSNVTFIINGQSTDQFGFNGQQFSAPVKLKAGVNSIQIKARNKTGSSSDLIKVNYKQEVVFKKPTVRFNDPSKAGLVVHSSAFALQAIVKEITDKKQITLKLNDQSLTNFSYDAKTGRLKANIDLKSGKNTIVLSARNKGGSASISTDMILQRNSRYEETAASKPRVTIISASRPALSRHGARSSALVVKIENVGSRNQIELIVNGQRVNDFSFDAKTKQMKSSVPLSRTSTNVKIKATNNAGSHEASRTIRL